jgi:hypothetical protein
MPTNARAVRGVAEHANWLPDNFFKRSLFDSACAHGTAGHSNRDPLCPNSVNATPSLGLARHSDCPLTSLAASEHTYTANRRIKILPNQSRVIRSRDLDHRCVIVVRVVAVSKLNVIPSIIAARIINVEPTGTISERIVRVDYCRHPVCRKQGFQQCAPVDSP